MSLCKICGASNPDTATGCQVCKAPLGKPDAAAMGGAPARRQSQGEGKPGQLPRRETVDESAGAWTPGKPDASPAGVTNAAARAAASSDTPRRRMTVFDPSHAAGPSGRGGTVPLQRPASTARKIVGVLVTYSWSDQGQIFPVYEGRNRIGSDPRECDIAVPQDDTLSAVNSHILFRKNFVIGDDVSMGGTDVDGQPVETAFVPLRNYARIRTGSTHWTFIAVQSPAGDAGNALAGSE
jgi:hypothetical protein